MQGLRAVQASCGGTHTMALTDTGRLFVWGRASFGRLGLGSERDALSPVEVFLPGEPHLMLRLRARHIRHVRQSRQDSLNRRQMAWITMY